MCSLAFLLTLSSGCMALRSSYLQESRPAPAPNHDCVAWHYREDALRLLTESIFRTTL
jgi:hypothetical protein